MRIFHTVRGRTLLVILIIMALSGFVSLRCKEPLVRRISGVKKDVYYLDQRMTGLLTAEVEDVVHKSAPQFLAETMDAAEDPIWTAGVIPHVAGLRLNVEETASKIISADRGEEVRPVLELVKPRVSLEDFAHRPVYRGHPAKEQVAFMINVAWGEEYLPAMLDVLEKEDTRATFFLVGRWAENNPDIVAELLLRGHELASHGYDDGIVLKGLSVEDAVFDIQKSLEVLGGHTGPGTVKYITPHKGEYDENTLQAAGSLNLRMVLWSLDTADWLQPGVKRMLERTVEKAFSGAVILMHPTQTGAEYLALALPRLREQGLHAVSVSSLLGPDPLVCKGKGAQP